MKQEINEELRRKLVELISQWRLIDDYPFQQATISRKIFKLLKKMEII